MRSWHAPRGLRLHHARPAAALPIGSGPRRSPAGYQGGNRELGAFGARVAAGARAETKPARQPVPVLGVVTVRGQTGPHGSSGTHGAISTRRAGAATSVRAVRRPRRISHPPAEVVYGMSRVDA